MKLPTNLVREAAILQYEFWDRENAKTHRTTRTPWEQVPVEYQLMWLEITRIVLEMAVLIVLSDADRFLEGSNGDMGAAFAKAIRRYASEVLDADIQI